MLGNSIFGAVFFALAVVVFPMVLVDDWFRRLMLLGTGHRPVSRQRSRAAGLVAALAAGTTACGIALSPDGEGYSVTSQLVRAPYGEIERVLVTPDVDEALAPVFRHSFEHSLLSAFQANGVSAAVSPFLGPGHQPGQEMHTGGPIAVMRVDVRPLYRVHRDGYGAMVGTLFEATLVDASTGEDLWRLSGKVDYIADQYFERHGYRAHEGILKEFAWHTTAAIVRAFMVDVEGRQSEPIYTDTETRQRHGQRTD